MKLKSISAALCLSLALTTALPYAAASSVTVDTPTAAASVIPPVNNALQGKLIAVEKILFGMPQTGAILEQLNYIEKEYYGSVRQGSLQERIDNIYEQIFDNSYAPSAIAQMNAIEWALMHKVSMEPIQTRLTNLETILYGKPQSGSFYSRMIALGNIAFGNSEEAIPMSHTIVPANTLIKIKLLTPINSETMQVGNIVKYEVAQNVICNGVLVFAKGAPGEGSVTKVQQARNFGRNGKVNIDFYSTQAFDGRTVQTTLGEKAKEEMKSEAMAAGASLAGIALLGPVGIIGGIFVKGQNVEMPAGTELYIQTKNDIGLYGVSVGGQSSADSLTSAAQTVSATDNTAATATAPGQTQFDVSSSSANSTPSTQKNSTNNITQTSF